MFSLWRVAADDRTQRAGTRFDFKVSLVVAVLLYERVGVEGSKQTSLKEIIKPSDIFHSVT